MSKYIVNKIKFLKGTTYSNYSLDGFAELHVSILDGSEVNPLALDVLNTNKNCELFVSNSNEQNKMLVDAYIEANILENIRITLNVIKSNSEKYVKLCSKKGGSFNLNCKIFSKQIYCKFIVSEEYQSTDETLNAWEKYKMKHNKMPDFTQWSTESTRHNDIILEIKFTEPGLFMFTVEE